MGGINSLGGLNKVSVDFRPAIDANAPDNANANQPQHVEPDASDAHADPEQGRADERPRR